jgi:hypothetical protein
MPKVKSKSDRPADHEVASEGSENNAGKRGGLNSADAPQSMEELQDSSTKLKATGQLHSKYSLNTKRIA